MALQRWSMGVAYDGADFAGWATQANVPSVQGAVEAALSYIADHKVSVQCAGRTDRGVHATSQVIHFDSDAPRTVDNWLRGTNAHLPDAIRITWVNAMPSCFHARYEANYRRYIYCIYKGKQMAWPGVSSWAMFEPGLLKVDAMHEAAHYLIGEHDFSAFRGSGCQSHSPNRCVTHLHCTQHGPWVIVDIQANAFVMHMVRNIVGVLLAVGRGQKPVGWVKSVLLSRDRRMAGVAAVAPGLYLVEVAYPDGYGVNVGMQLPWFLPGLCLAGAPMAA